MYAGIDWSEWTVGENRPLTLDFVNDGLVDGENLASATWSCVAVIGTDASAATRLTGVAAQSGTKTSQQCTGFLVGVKYLLEAVVVTTLGNTFKLHSHITCKAAT